jgi:hypothetical protein
MMDVVWVRRYLVQEEREEQKYKNRNLSHMEGVSI